MSEKANHTGWRERPLFRKAVVICLVATALLTAYWSYQWSLRRRLQSHYDAFRADGYPVTLAELDAWYPEPPPGENAADLLIVAFGKLVGTDWQSLPPERRSYAIGATVYLPQHNREALALLHDALRKPECRYPVDLTTITDPWLAHHVCVRNAVSAMRLEVREALETGGTERAVLSLIDAMTLARSLRNEPLVPALQMGLGTRSAVASESGCVLAAPLTDDQLLRLADAFRRAEDPHLLARALAGETCIINAKLADKRRWRASLYINGVGERIAFEAWRGLLECVGYWKSRHGEFLGAMRDSVIASQSPFPGRLRATTRPSAALSALQGRTFGSPMLLVASASDGLAVYEAACFARLRAARTAMAVERFRLANGRIPERLDELAPRYIDAVPTDPFDGKPLRYRKLPKGYIVYSIGEDMVDDGGYEFQQTLWFEMVSVDGVLMKRSKAGTKDIAVTVERE